MPTATPTNGNRSTTRLLVIHAQRWRCGRGAGVHKYRQGAAGVFCDLGKRFFGGLAAEICARFRVARESEKANNLQTVNLLVIDLI